MKKFTLAAAISFVLCLILLFSAAAHSQQAFPITKTSATAQYQPPSIVSDSLTTGTHNYDIQTQLSGWWTWDWYWTHNTDSIGFIIYKSNKGVNWSILRFNTNVDTVWSADATGNVSFEDMGKSSNFLRTAILVTDSATVGGDFLLTYPVFFYSTKK